MGLLAKFVCTSVSLPAADGTREVEFAPADGEPSKFFRQHTTSGSIKLGITAECPAKFVKGKAYLVDFAAAEK